MVTSHLLGYNFSFGVCLDIDSDPIASSRYEDCLLRYMHKADAAGRLSEVKTWIEERDEEIRRYNRRVLDEVEMLEWLCNPGRFDGPWLLEHSIDLDKIK